MTSAPRPGHARVRFDELAWARDLAAATPAGRAAAQRARAQLERDGAPVQALRACEPEAADGTRLPGCVKLYVPAPAGPWGIVFRLAMDARGPVLTVLAFGLRHPPAGRRASVYQTADRRLTGIEPRAKGSVRWSLLAVGMDRPNEQLALVSPQTRSEGVKRGRGYVTTRKRSQKRRAVTSFEMSLEERALLDRLVETQGLGIGAVLRRGLQL